LLEVESLDVTTESIRTVTGAKSWMKSSTLSGCDSIAAGAESSSVDK